MTLFPQRGRYHCSNSVSSRVPRERRPLRETIPLLVSWDALLRCLEWERVCDFGVSLKMCSMLADFVASDHMVKVLLLRHFFGAPSSLGP